MKKSVLLLIILIFSANTSYSDTGAAYIPYNLSSTTVSNEMGVTISNITDDIVSVTITMYDLNGNKITSASAFTQNNNVAQNIDTSPTGATISFDIPANATASLTYGNWAGHGYGKIEWTQNSNRRTALLAHALRNNSGSFSIPINAGLPF